MFLTGQYKYTPGENVPVCYNSQMLYRFSFENMDDIGTNRTFGKGIRCLYNMIHSDAFIIDAVTMVDVTYDSSFSLDLSESLQNMLEYDLTEMAAFRCVVKQLNLVLNIQIELASDYMDVYCKELNEKKLVMLTKILKTL